MSLLKARKFIPVVPSSTVWMLTTLFPAVVEQFHKQELELRDEKIYIDPITGNVIRVKGNDKSL